MRQTTKDAVIVAGHGQAHAMAITQSFMQACISAYSVLVYVYKTHRTREEKVMKAKEQRLKDQGEEPVAKEQKEAIMSMKSKK